VIAPVVPEISEETGAGAGVIGVLVTCFGIGQLAGYPLAGALARRWPAVRVLAVSVVLTAAGDLGFVLGDGLGAYFPARAVQGIAAGGLWMGIVFAVLERWPGQEYRRLTGLLAAYSLGGVAGPALGAVGGIGTPFLVHLALAGAAGLALPLLGPPAERPRYASDRAVLRSPGFVLASAGILLVAVGLGALDGPLPLHFAEELSQAEIAALYVGGSLVVGAAAVACGRLAPRAALLLGVVLTPLGIEVAGFGDGAAAWIAGVAIAALGLGAGETGALGVLLETVGVERMVLAMVVWSQVWGVGYLAGPAAAGGIAEGLGFAAVGLVPLAASAAVVLAFRRRPAPSGAVG
jgi:MFS family permease